MGRSLADQLKWSFVDTDSLLVRQQQMSIKEMVGAYGWEGFRNMEHGALKTVCKSKSQVVATGGGIVIDDQNVMIMRQSGRIIWLRARLETIKSRMLQDKNTREFRPALTLENSILEIEESLQSREHIYHRAMDFFVDTDDHDIWGITNIIAEKLNTMPGAI